MEIQIVRVDCENYARFADMVFWRKNGEERTPSTDAPSAQICAELQNENLCVYAAEADGRFVGWISLIYLPKIGHWGGRGHVYVDELWVAPACRRMGIAKRLLSEADAMADELGAHGVRLYVNIENPGAQLLYAGLGYEPSGTAVMMEK